MARDPHTKDPVLLVGAGAMAVSYAAVLQALGRPFVVLGRGSESARRFTESTGVAVTTGPLDRQLAALDRAPSEAIVTVNAMHLADVTAQLAAAGVRRALVEKPAALDSEELDALRRAAAATDAEIVVGYNRRFLESVLTARRFIEEDGGVLSVKFDFSEPSRRIATLAKPQRELDTWFYGNSSHVIDLALHFAGAPREIAAVTSRRATVPWHPGPAVFAGHATSVGGALLSWHANWVGPGRWGVEVVTAERRLILRPLERLSLQTHSGFDEVEVDLDLELDQRFKPGLYRQVDAFLSGNGATSLLTLDDHAARWQALEAIRIGRSWKSEETTTRMPHDTKGET